MSKAQARQGTGGRSGATRAGASSKNSRTAGSAGSRTASGSRAGGTANGNRADGQAQRGQAASATATGGNSPKATGGNSPKATGGNSPKATGGNSPKATGPNGARTATGADGGARRPATATAKPATRQGAKAAAAVRGNRWLLGMTGIEASTLILSVIGLGVAVYATILHYDSNIQPLCSASGAINCEEVMTSSQSVVFGIFPVAVLGMAFFLFMIAINTPWAWRAKFPRVLDRVGGRALSSRPGFIRWTRLGSIIVGMGFAIYLIYAELVQIQKICLWCTSVHIITFLLFVIIVFNASFSWGRTDAPRT
jgi:uncharacterized membrane protein